MYKQVTRTIFIGWLGLIGLLGLIELNMPSPSYAQPGRFGDGPGPHDFSPGPPDHAGHAGHARPRGPRGPRGVGGPPPGRFIERQAERLGLDEETRSSIRAIADTSHAKGKEIRKSLRQAHREMRELLQQDSPNEANVLQQAENIGTLQVKEQQNRLQAMLQIRVLLTPAQRQEIIQLRQEDRPHRRRRGRRRGKRRGQPFRVCREDITQLCPDAEPGRSSIQCLTTIGMPFPRNVTPSLNVGPSEVRADAVEIKTFFSETVSAESVSLPSRSGTNTRSASSTIIFFSGRDA